MKRVAALAAVVLAIAACGPKKSENKATGPTPVKNNSKLGTAEHDPVPTPAVKPGRVDPAAVPMDVKLRASHGKDTKDVYVNAVAAIYDPDDVKEFTAFDEYGYRNAIDYKTYGNIPAGYWVYASPYWVVWQLKNGKPGN